MFFHTTTIFCILFLFYERILDLELDNILDYASFDATYHLVHFFMRRHLFQCCVPLIASSRTLHGFPGVWRT